MSRLLLAWFRRHARDLPWRRTRDPYAIWVSEIMLQQTQVKTVIPYWTRWMERFPTLQTLARAQLSSVLKAWEGLGYYRRARNLHAAAQEIVDARGGRFPQDAASWLTLPGIGRYTAGAIASIAFNEPAPILDGNVARVLSRLFLVRPPRGKSSAASRLWELANEFVQTAAGGEPDSDRACGDLNQSLMELGATVCLPQQARCEDCPLRQLCQAHATGQIDAYPPPARRPATVNRTRIILALQHRGRWLLQQRAPREQNAGLWEFPGVDLPASLSGPEAARTLTRRFRGIQHLAATPAFTLRQQITHHRILLSVHVARPRPGGKPPHLPRARWCSAADLRVLALSSAHRRIANRLAGARPFGPA